MHIIDTLKVEHAITVYYSQSFYEIFSIASQPTGDCIRVLYLIFMFQLIISEEPNMLRLWLHSICLAVN